MHPAPSIIVFTALSGLGFGAIFWLALGLAPTDMGVWPHILAFILASIGLLASTQHLGHPERAWRALTQWRSSWLSREGVLAILTLGFAALVILMKWTDVEVPFLVGLILAVLSVLTVYATSMIYAQLRTVPRWFGSHTPVKFIVLALAGGMLLLCSLAVVSGGATKDEIVIALIAAGLGGAATLFWRAHSDGKHLSDAGTPETATGLAAQGKVRLLERPHTSANYLMNEMVFRIGRDRALALRRLVLMIGTVLPVLLCVVAFIVGSPFLIILATISHIVGIFCDRWLFFAEAEHVVGNYYGFSGR